MRWAAAAFLCLGMLALPSNAFAEPPPTFAKFCKEGSAAGECLLPRGIATSSTNGHIYVADQVNNRINEFTVWGEFIKAWGWGVDDGAAQLQTCTTESSCQAGLAGSGLGQFGVASGVATDSAGNIYVVDWSTLRVQKFDPEGGFLLMFGGGVNQGPSNPGNVCTATHIAEGDTCGAGTSGTGNGQFSSGWAIGNTIAIGPNDEVYVGDRGRIQEFDTSGGFVRVLPDPDQVLSNGNPAENKAVGSLAASPVDGDLYLGYPNGRFEFEKTLPDVRRLDEGAGQVLDTLDVAKPSAIGTDLSGNVYVFDQLLIINSSPSDPGSHGTRILKFDSTGNLIETIGETAMFDPSEFLRSVGIATEPTCFSGGSMGLYVVSHDLFEHSYDFVQAYGPTPDPAVCPPPDVPPSINGQFASSVGTASAALRAEINPHYFTRDVGTTTYYVQWGTAGCIDDGGWEAGCVQKQPTPPGAVIDSIPVGENLTTDRIVLSGLQPATNYRYRFIAERERDEEGADPPVWIVIGEGGEPGVQGEDADFTTMPLETTAASCSNDVFRIGAGAGLRDCRAYELVSPLDKDGGDAQARLNLVPFEARMDQASLSGNEITFSAARAFQAPQSAPFSSQYLTKRDPADGWKTEAISPPQEGEGFINPLIPIDNLYRAFSPDLSQAWLMTDTEPVLGPGGLPELPNLYRRDNSSDAYQACTTAVPATPGEEAHGPQLQGFSADGNLAIFRIENKLTENASEKVRDDGSLIYQVYSCSFEGGVAKVRLVSALPDGSASELENTAGGPANEAFQLNQGRTESLENAVSVNGDKVFWTANNGIGARDPGALYVRLNPSAEPTASGSCEGAEPDKACTVLISAGPARFWTAAEDGSIAIFSTAGGDLNEYELDTGETHPIADEVVGVLGASEDVSRIYFLSEADLGDGATAGDPNLYLYDKGAGTTTFIATLSELDAESANRVPAPATPEPVWHSSRVSPDGQTVAFMSNDAELAEQVAGYDNTDQVGGTPAAEIYRYGVGGSLACISCNRTGQRPQGREVQNQSLQNNPPVYAASMLPTWLNSLYAPRVMSSDGERIFFESFESLSLQDHNDKIDVYQWEAKGKGTCTMADSAYESQSEGCVSLLTSGKSNNDSQFVDASPTGNDAFIRTASSLVDWDPGAIDIYDARVEGGLPAPPLPPNPNDECEAEACRPPMTPPPPALVPPTAAPGPGNVRQGTRKVRRCPKGTRKVKVKGKVRCVRVNKQKKQRGKGRAGNNRRAAR